MLAYLMCALSCVLAYLICGFPSAYVIGERMAHLDVRTVGSGNVGTTNIARSVGKKAAALTLLLDVLKAVLAVFVGYGLIGLVGCGDLAAVRPGGRLDWAMALVYASCILGHVFTPYLHFKGGKGIAVGFGGALALMWPVGLLLLVPFLVFAVLTRYVSLGSILAAVALPFLAWAVERPSAAFLVVIVCVALLVIWSHRANIVRLAHGQEKRFAFKKKGVDAGVEPGVKVAAGTGAHPARQESQAPAGCGTHGASGEGR